MRIGFVQVISAELRSNRRLVRCSSSAAAEIFSSKKLPVIYSDKFLQHDAGRPHPERPARVAAIKQRLNEDEEISESVSFHEPSADENTTLKFISEVHYEDYVDQVKRLSGYGDVRSLDGDTYVNGATYNTAVTAARAWMDAVDYAYKTGRPAFALTRPPGHHATIATGMGFCIFCNAAIASAYAIKELGLSKISILDWDVHHGNGTEAWAKTNPQVRMTSSHQYPFYPFTGAEADVGMHNNIKNVALSAESNWSTLGPRFRNEMLPFISGEGWEEPDLVIVSAGYDALAVDPLAQVELDPEDFATMTREILTHLGHGRVVFGLEGGYHLDGISEAFAMTVDECIKFVREKELG